MVKSCGELHAKLALYRERKATLRGFFDLKMGLVGELREIYMNYRFNDRLAVIFDLFFTTVFNN